jgi:hypothetical protein
MYTSMKCCCKARGIRDHDNIKFTLHHKQTNGQGTCYVPSPTVLDKGILKVQKFLSGDNSKYKFLLCCLLFIQNCFYPLLQQTKSKRNMYYLFLWLSTKSHKLCCRWDKQCFSKMKCLTKLPTFPWHLIGTNYTFYLCLVHESYINI